MNISEIVNLSNSPTVKADLIELNKYAPHILSVLTQYEGADVRAHLVIDKLNQLANWLDVSTLQGVQHQASTQALQKSFKKLKGYMSEDTTVRF